MAFPNNFEKVLNDFFHRYHPRKKEKIPAIVKEFAGNEKEVLLLLCKKYGVDPNTIDGLMAYTPAISEPVNDNQGSVERAEKVTTDNQEEEEEGDNLVEENPSEGSEEEEKKED